MKKILLYLFVAAIASAAFISCSKEELSSTSVIKDAQVEQNEFDRWIEKNYTQPYNIALLYRMEDIESDMNYNLAPAEYEKAIKIAILTRHLCLQAYDEVTGNTAFIRTNFPKLLHLVGSAAVRNNNTEVIGTAEGGAKITLYKVNALDINNMAHMNEYFFHTQHHEFGHILNQKKPYSSDFKTISSANYVGDSWNTSSLTTALRAGFITPYASSSDGEDFVELISVYVTSSPDEWAARLSTAGESGAPIIRSKFDIVKSYMQNSWGIGLDSLRNTVQRRQDEVSSLNFDL
jgi:substrate import-associated zinc metallohydrolase lipoprotein